MYIAFCIIFTLQQRTRNLIQIIYLKNNLAIRSTCCSLCCYLVLRKNGKRDQNK